MADIPPVNPGAEPMKKSTGRVQPKKETVRINLPPKPTAAPTIKLPTLPPGGPTGAPSAAPLPPTPPASTTLRSTASAAQRSPAATPATAPASQQRAPAARPVPATALSPVDKILAIAAAVLGLAAVGTTVWMMLILNTAVTS